MSMLLDLVEVAKSHSRANLAEAFVNILDEFGIEDKVSMHFHSNTCKTHLACQILSITSDNASNNDVMVKHIAELVPNFPGPANQTRCFTHILNLVAKSILRQFDTVKAVGDSPAINEASDALASLALELDSETAFLVGDDQEDKESDERGDEDDEDDNDDDGGLGDGRDGMSQGELADLEASVVPIRLMLTKVKQYYLI